VAEAWSRAYLSKQRLLVVAPHADDETAGAGGLIARVKDAGGKAYVMVLSTGDLLHFDDTGRKTRKRTRKEELAAAMRTLGVDGWEIVYEDTRLHLAMETLPRKELVHQIERRAEFSTEKVKPTMIVLPAPSFNQDHEAIFKAGIAACRPHLASLKSFQSAVLVADAPQLAWRSGYTFRPTLYVDISGRFLDLKLRAFACHASQLRPEPSQAGLGAIRLMAEMRGREISVAAAEAFEALRFVV
jgi:LmbE family N-acetylglucosaminyl deacetylase